MRDLCCICKAFRCLCLRCHLNSRFPIQSIYCIQLFSAVKLLYVVPYLIRLQAVDPLSIKCQIFIRHGRTRKWMLIGTVCIPACKCIAIPLRIRSCDIFRIFFLIRFRLCSIICLIFVGQRMRVDLVSIVDIWAIWIHFEAVDP